MKNDQMAEARARLDEDIKAAERRFIEAVGPLATPDDDFPLARWALVRHLRSKGLKFHEIGELFGFTANQARVLYLKSERCFE